MRVEQASHPAGCGVRATAWLQLTLAIHLLLAPSAAIAEGLPEGFPTDAAEPPVAIRIVWGGGKPIARRGAIRLLDETAGAGPANGASAVEPEWRMLSTDPLATATLHAAGDAIHVHEPRGLDLNGVEIRVADWSRARLRVELGPAEGGEQPVVIETAVADLLDTPLQQPLDTAGNRLSLKRAPGDELRVSLPGDHPGVYRAGETVRLAVHPLMPRRLAAVTAPELRLRLIARDGGSDLHSQSVVLKERPSAAEAGPQAYEPVVLAVPLPAEEGGYDISLEIVERGGIRWSRATAARTIQLVAVADLAPVPRNSADWKVLYELDPGSPKLLERLRRLPGMGMTTIAAAGVPLPKLPRPSFSLPKMPIPTPSLPSLPLGGVTLPHVPVPKFPSMNSMVPRLTGLLAVGHSTLESHPLGPMLKLPPAAGEESVWEGVALGAVEPGMPHLVEIEYPLDQEAIIGVTILEQTGAVVRSTGGSGFEVEQDLLPNVDGGSPAARLGTHRFVFWPQTRSPLVLVSNLSPRSAATFGRLRVLAGPEALPAARSRQQAGDALPMRPTYLHLASPEFRMFGAAERIDAASGRPSADWNGMLGGIERSAEWTAAQGLAGAMIPVYGEGAAIWPSRLTGYAPRWDSGGSADASLDPTPKDMLEVLGRVYSRKRLRIVPALVFNGAMPVLERFIASGEAGADGILCLGRDGRPQGGAGGHRSPRYNPLDPRVQDAVDAVVAELADRLRATDSVTGIAILLPHDGWLHLPGLAWGLDDATFGRFAAAVAEESQPLVRPVLGTVDGSRFAGRAALVEGPLREQWMAWREAELARFFGRISATIAARNPAWTLSLGPTTLFSQGPLAERFRPALSIPGLGAGILREIGIDPGRITAEGRIVYLAPQVHEATADIVERGIVENANRSLRVADGPRAAVRQAAMLVETPVAVDVRPVLPHGPFTSTEVEPVSVPVLAVGRQRGRGLAESLVAADLQAVFEMASLHRLGDDDDAGRRRGLELLPAGIETVAGTPAPLVVRTRSGEAGLWVSLANACGVPCRAELACDGTPLGVVDAVTHAALPIGAGGGCGVVLGAWETRTIVIEGVTGVRQAAVVFDDSVRDAVARLLTDLRGRRAALEMAVPLAVLDNPGFDLPELGGVLPGWDLLEPRRGDVKLVAGRPPATGKALRFGSTNGLATVRSNPFRPPLTGRISVAVWLRISPSDPQPPLRIAIEGVRNDVEYYRFAAVGSGAAMPIGAAWSQFVLQVDDLPTQGIESLRVRLDLLGPGGVEIDDVRVFDLAFDESQRVGLSRQLAAAEERLTAGDVGGCLTQIDGHWPRFLRAFVPAQAAALALPPAGSAPAGRPEQSGPAGVIGRMRQWWQ